MRLASGGRGTGREPASLRFDAEDRQYPARSCSERGGKSAAAGAQTGTARMPILARVQRRAMRDVPSLGHVRCHGMFVLPALPIARRAMPVSRNANVDRTGVELRRSDQDRREPKTPRADQGPIPERVPHDMKNTRKRPERSAHLQADVGPIGPSTPTRLPS